MLSIRINVFNSGTNGNFIYYIITLGVWNVPIGPKFCTKPPGLRVRAPPTLLATKPTSCSPIDITERLEEGDEIELKAFWLYSKTPIGRAVISALASQLEEVLSIGTNSLISLREGLKALSLGPPLPSRSFEAPPSSLARSSKEAPQKVRSALRSF